MKGKTTTTPEGIKRLTLTAILLALAVVLAVVENMLPPLPIAVNGIKLGLSNIPVMYSLFFVSKGQAFTIAALKSLFAGITRGWIAGVLSLCGGWLSLVVMLLLLLVFKEKISYLILSIAGAVCHNLGQLAAVSVLYTTLSLWAIFPILLAFGVGAGVVTALLLKLVLPALKKLDLK